MTDDDFRQPELDRAALRKLRDAMREIQSADGSGIPMRELVNLARDVGPGAAMTIDFEAARELGQPMVVLRLPPRSLPDSRLARLSPRELEVAKLVATGLRNREIAQRLFISLATVKDHVHNILEKTGLGNRTALVAAMTKQT